MKQKNILSELPFFLFFAFLLYIPGFGFAAEMPFFNNRFAGANYGANAAANWNSDGDSFWDRADVFVELTPSFMINNESKTISAPNPAFFPIVAGFSYPNDTFFSVEPTFSFFYTNCLVYNKTVVPAEIENRTATALSFMLNIPAVFTINFNNISKIKLCPGAALLFRIPIPASGIDATEIQSDLSVMRLWFYEKGRFAYLSFKASWTFEHIEKLSFGPVVAIYYPLITSIAEKTFSGTIISAGLRLVF